MKKSIKYSSLGSFSNDGLGSGLGFAERSEEDLIEMLKIINEKYLNIKTETIKKLHRVDDFLKKEIGIIPEAEDFADWLFTTKSIKENNQKNIKIKDADLIQFTKEYVEYLTKLIHNKDSMLKLNYGEKNSAVIALLYEYLYPKKIEIQKNEFFKHFESNKNDLIIWKSTEVEFVNLFSSIRFENTNILEELTKHFLNSKGKYFLPNQLSVSKSKTTESNYGGKEFVKEIIKQIKELQKS